MIPLMDLAEASLSFYRSPDSLFASGETTKKELESSVVETRSEMWCLIQYGSTENWVPESNLVFYSQFYQGHPMEAMAYVTKDSLSLRNRLGWQNDKVIKAGRLVSINKIKSDWSCGHDNKGPICVPTKHIVLGIDTAQKIQVQGGQWHRLKGRENQYFETTTGQRFLYSDIKMWEPDSQLAFIKPHALIAKDSDGHDESPPPFGRVRIIKKETRQWKQSLLKNHGFVWWRVPEAAVGSPAPIIISQEEILNLPTFDKAESETLSVVSSDGVFVSTDKATWRLLPDFNDQNLPVAIGPKDSLIVGDKISFNQGKSFQPFIRWEEVALMAQNILGQTPQQMRIARVKASKDRSIEVHIETHNETGGKTLVFDFNTVNNRLRPKGSPRSIQK